MMRILVTGGYGFVGINLVRDLAKAFPKALIFAADVLPADDRVQAFLAPVRDRVQLRRLDVRDCSEFECLAAECRCTHLVHAAAVTPDPIRERVQSPDIVEINLCGAIHALRVAYENARIEKFVFISSSGVYGAPLEMSAELIGEDDPLKLDHLYGICKSSAEMLTSQYAAYTGKPMASLRLASIYGPMERNTGSRTGMSLPRQLMNAFQNHKVIKLYGKEMARDWLHTADVSLAVERLFHTEQWQHSIYNVGSGETLSAAALLDVFSEYGLQATWVDKPEEADIAFSKSGNRQALAIDRLHADTGFIPARVGIQAFRQYIQEELGIQEGEIL